MTSTAPLSHQPVLLTEALTALHLHPGGRYVDATFGRGGHAAALLATLGPEGRVLALDRDPAAARCAAERFGGDARFSFVRAAFGRLAEVVAERGWSGRVDGILLDLGVSSPQLDDPARGFSFNRDGPLDMRMDPTMGSSAAEWLDRIDEVELGRVLAEYGEERFYRRVARAVVAARRQAPVATTQQLAAIVAATVPTREPGKHPATRTFKPFGSRSTMNWASCERCCRRRCACWRPVVGWRSSVFIPWRIGWSSGLCGNRRAEENCRWICRWRAPQWE
jgi:16S rRNA (cytosine1402-N4)-methyltransferase